MMKAKKQIKKVNKKKVKFDYFLMKCNAKDSNKNYVLLRRLQNDKQLVFVSGIIFDRGCGLEDVLNILKED